MAPMRTRRRSNSCDEAAPCASIPSEAAILRAYKHAVLNIALNPEIDAKKCKANWKRDSSCGEVKTLAVARSRGEPDKGVQLAKRRACEIIPGQFAEFSVVCSLWEVQTAIRKGIELNKVRKYLRGHRGPQRSSPEQGKR